MYIKLYEFTISHLHQFKLIITYNNYITCTVQYLFRTGPLNKKLLQKLVILLHKTHKMKIISGTVNISFL